MKKNRIIIASVLIFFVSVLWIYREPLVALGTSTFTEGKSNIATTTPTYLTSGAASSTLIAGIGSADSVYMNLIAIASTTGTRYQWEFETSVDGIDYFPIGVLGTTTVVNNNLAWYASSTQNYMWTPGKTATTSIQIKVPDVVGNYLRVKYSAGAGNGALWLNIIPKRNTN